MGSCGPGAGSSVPARRGSPRRRASPSPGPGAWRSPPLRSAPPATPPAVEQLARRRRQLPVQPGGLVGVVRRPGLCLAVAARPARAPPLTPPCRGWGPRLGLQEDREPGVKLWHALLRDRDCDLLVRHQISVVCPGCWPSPAPRSSASRAQRPRGAPRSGGHDGRDVACLAAPASPAGQEPREESVELGDSVLGNVDGDLLVVGLG